jgi:hypothetical protein
MKTANVLEVRDARATLLLDPAYTDPAKRARAEELLQRYPATTKDETGEIVDFLARGMHLDIGLVTAKQEFKEKAAAIRSAHPEAFRLGILRAILFVLIVLTPLALIVLLPHLLGRS